MRSLAGTLIHTPPVRAAAVLILLLGVVGCGRGHSSPDAAPGAPATSSGTAATPPAVFAAAETTPSTTGKTAPPPDEALCSEPVFLPVLKEEFDDEARRLHIVTAEVKRCGNGYAQVFAVPDGSLCEPGIGYCYEREQVFLESTDGGWRIVTYGTGISCQSPGFETDDAIRIACRALGYPGY